MEKLTAEPGSVPRAAGRGAHSIHKPKTARKRGRGEERERDQEAEPHELQESRAGKMKGTCRDGGAGGSKNTPPKRTPEEKVSVQGAGLLAHG